MVGVGAGVCVCVCEGGIFLKGRLGETHMTVNASRLLVSVVYSTRCCHRRGLKFKKRLGADFEFSRRGQGEEVDTGQFQKQACDFFFSSSREFLLPLLRNHRERTKFFLSAKMCAFYAVVILIGAGMAYSQFGQKRKLFFSNTLNCNCRYFKRISLIW